MKARYRSAITGQFVTKKKAKRNPRTTVAEGLKRNRRTKGSKKSK